MGNETILRRDDTVLLMIDMQEKLLPVMQHSESVLSKVSTLLKAANILSIPIFYTEQYPKGLGSTAASLLTDLTNAKRFEKMTFSCCGSDTFLDALGEIGRDQVLICGIESHVCVSQTALDLLDEGAQVHVAVDACSSRSADCYQNALSRMSREGVILTNAESAVFEMLHVAGTDEFKQISRLIK